MRTSFLRFVAVVLIAISSPAYDVGAQVVSPAASALPRDAYVQESWSVEDGLPVNSVTGLLQGRDGYLWVATFDGLVRFDGVRFTVYNSATSPGLPSNRIVYLQQTLDGTLYLTTEQRQLVRFRDGVFTLIRDVLLDPYRYPTLLEDHNGITWVATRDGVGVIRGDRLERVAQETIRGRVTSVVEQRDGSVWVTTMAGDLFRVIDRVATRVASRDRFGGDSLTSLLIDRDGTLWIGGSSSVWKLRGDSLDLVLKGPDDVSLTLFQPPSTRAIWGATRHLVYKIDSTGTRLILDSGNSSTVVNDFGVMLWDSAGSVRFALDRSLVRERRGGPDGRSYETVVTLPSTISAAAYDHEGSLWLGTQLSGLFRIKPTNVRMLTHAIGAGLNNVYTVSEMRDGAVFYGGGAGDVLRVGNGQVRAADGIPKMTGQWTRSLLESRDGRLLVGSAALSACDTRTLRCEDVKGAPPGLQSITAMHEDSTGIWFGSMGGLFRLERGTWRSAPADAPTSTVRAFLRTTDGALWMGTAGGGLARLHDGKFRTVSTAEGLPSSLVRSLYQDADGWLWVGTEGLGLARLDPREWNDANRRGRIVAISRKDGLFDDAVHMILEDQFGRIWMNGNRGVSWVERRELQAFADGRAAKVTATSYTERDGLRNREGNGGSQPAGVRTRDGRIWFPTQDGVAVFDPASIRRNLIPPPVAIEQVVAGSDTLRATGAPVSLGTGRRDIQIAYTALSFIAPANVRFRYRLEPYDPAWVDAGSRRTAFYTRVPPGKYTFRVLASNNDGVWNEQGAALRLELSPRVWETTTFRVLLVIALLGLTALLVQMRLRGMRTRAAALEGVIESRTRELRDRNAQLAELHESRSRLFANLSHEFRTPLTLILGPLRSLLDGRHGNLSPSVSEQGNLMLRNGQRLLRLINQVLDLSRLQAGAVALERRSQDLVAFARATTQAFAPLAERRRISLEFRSDTEAIAVAFDREQLEKVLLNLLSNALKFTEPGGSVHVTVATTGDEATIAVCDSGVGIAADQLPHVFDRFYQGDPSTTRRYEGTGIGLALARELVELHGGSIAAESTVGEGSVFTVRLPIDATVPAIGSNGDASDARERAAIEITAEEHIEDRGETEPAAVAEGDQTTVLLVDDNADVRAFVRSLLSSDYRILEAPNGRAGLDIARAELPDLIVADVMMPELDGLALGRALKDDTMTDAIPVILLSARAASEDQVAGLETGADAYLLKPFDPAVLTATVAGLLTQRRRLRDRFRLGVETMPAPEEAERSVPSAIEQRLRPLVQARLTDPALDPNELASAAGLSYHQMYRALRDELGVSPSRFIRTVRVECAAELLKQGTGSVTEVAYSVGFDSLSHFSRSFHERFGAAPSAFATRGAASAAAVRSHATP